MNSWHIRLKNRNIQRERAKRNRFRSMISIFSFLTPTNGHHHHHRYDIENRWFVKMLELMMETCCFFLCLLIRHALMMMLHFIEILYYFPFCVWVSVNKKNQYRWHSICLNCNRTIGILELPIDFDWYCQYNNNLVHQTLRSQKYRWNFLFKLLIQHFIAPHPSDVRSRVNIIANIRYFHIDDHRIENHLNMHSIVYNSY